MILVPFTLEEVATNWGLSVEQAKMNIDRLEFRQEAKQPFEGEQS